MADAPGQTEHTRDLDEEVEVARADAQNRPARPLPDGPAKPTASATDIGGSADLDEAMEQLMHSAPSAPARADEAQIDDLDAELAGLASGLVVGDEDGLEEGVDPPAAPTAPDEPAPKGQPDSQGSAEKPNGALDAPLRPRSEPMPELTLDQPAGETESRLPSPAIPAETAAPAAGAEPSRPGDGDGHAGGVGRPNLVRAAVESIVRRLAILSRPLEGRSRLTRDTIGYIGLGTLFWAVCAWAFVMLRIFSGPPASSDAAPDQAPAVGAASSSAAGHH